MAKYHPRQNQRKRLIGRFFMPMLKILALILMLGLIIFGLLKSNQADFLKVDIRWEIDKN
ncbi:MAG: hypothetical protein HAW58_04750, partial [Candidatus Thioglobus sp.]|nr:hypothetical protein [Candidatus Thioglobus sp.]